MGELMEKEDVANMLARAVLSFQDKFMSTTPENAPSALLCQGWPFCVAGQGDLLALFRCISCRFTFGVDPARPEQLGAPGRVFLSAEPELACNVANYPRDLGYESYLRRAEAQQCNVQSSMLLPVFAAPSLSSRTSPTGSGSLPRAAPVVAVIEVVQSSGDMQFLRMVQLLACVLESCPLYTSTKEEVMARLPTAATHLALPQQTGLLETPHRADSSGKDSGDGDHQATQQAQQAAEPDGARVGPAEPRSFTGAAGTSAGERQPRAQQEQLRQEHDDGEGQDDMLSDHDPGGEGQDGGEEGGGSGRQRRRAGIGKSGQPGTKLQLEDLQSHFGVGLKQAAARLGICATTLKRACRRHGIQRWPHRALVKVNRALDEMEQWRDPASAFAGPPGSMPLPPTAAMPPYGSVMLPLHTSVAAAQQQQQQQQQQGGAAVPGPSFEADTRWTTLANFIPAFIQAAAAKVPPLAPPRQSVHAALGGGGAAAPNAMWMPAWPTAAGTPAASKGSLPDGVIVVNGGPAVSVASGLSGWEGGAAGAVDLAAAALARRAAAEHRSPPQNVVPSLLRAGVPPGRDLLPAPATLSVMSGMDDPVVRLPASTATGPWVGPHCGISQLSLPSLGRDISLLQRQGSLGGLSGGIMGGFAGSPGEDVMMGASMVQFLLSEESQGVVNATDHDLQRLFDGSNCGGTNRSRLGDI